MALSTESIQDIVFIGLYQERRYVEGMNIYRDIIQVDGMESEFITELLRIEKYIRKTEGKDTWTGITISDFEKAKKKYLLWVDLQGLPFGHYWFKVKSVKYSVISGLDIQIKCLRKISKTKTEQDSNIGGTERSRSNVDNIFNTKNIPETVKNANIYQSMKELVTLNNITEAARFLIILLVIILTGSLKFIKHFWDIVIRIIHESGIVIYHATPLCLGILDFMGKVIGGFYMLLAMIWRDWMHSSSKKECYSPSKQRLAIMR